MQVNLELSSNGLQTIRVYTQTPLLLITTLLGSVFGMMGAVGGVMRLFEGNLNILKAHKENLQNKEDIANSHIDLKAQVYNELEDDVSCEPTRIFFDELAFNIDSI